MESTRWYRGGGWRAPGGTGVGDGEHPVVQGWGMESTRWYRGGGGRAPGGTGVRE